MEAVSGEARNQAMYNVSVFKKMLFTFTNNQSSYPPTSTINTLITDLVSE